MPRTTNNPPQPAPPSTDASPSKAAINQLMASMWKRNLPLTHERFAFLDRFASDLRTAEPTPDARKEAISIAHKFVGSLGMFGYPHGTTLARELETLLDTDAPLDPSAVGDLVRQLHDEVFPQPS
jgi:HPt (histidine-containing phosphotransfer) domain-containing protein